MKKPELLIPASSLEVLKTAVMFGADAVYIGGEAFGLRAKAKNFSLEDMKGKTAYFGGINKCKFRRKVAPGDKLRLETKIIRRKGPVGIGSAVASVDGEVAVEAELTFMIG